MQSVNKTITTGWHFRQKIFFSSFFLLTKTVLGDSESCSIVPSSQPKYTEAARISEILETINKTMET